MSLKSILQNPFRLIFSFILISALFTVMVCIVLAITTPGGEQLPLTFLATMIAITAYTVMAIAVVSIPFYVGWVKKNWFVNLLFMIPGIYFLYGEIYNADETDGNTISIQTLGVGGKKYEKKAIFYGSSNKLHSVSFMCNSKKDSTWITYNEDGSIASKEIYQDGELLIKVK